MCDFLKVDNLNTIKFTTRWKDPLTFNSEGRFINKHNQYVKESSPEPMFQVIMKKERFFTGLERIGRVAKGLFYNLLTLGLCNLNRECRRLFTDDKKIMRIAIRVPNQKNTLKVNLQMSEKTLEQTQQMIT